MSLADTSIDTVPPGNGESLSSGRNGSDWQPSPKKRTLQILGIPFLENNATEAVALSLEGGLVLVPAAPPLAGDFLRDFQYRESLLNADFVLPDSGAMVLIWNLAHPFSPAKRLARLSGLEFIKALVVALSARPEVRSFWIMPNEREQAANLRWLHSRNVAGASEKDCYVAPNYGATRSADGALRDEELLAQIEAARPDVIVVNLGGGIQEKLGLFLKRELSYRPAIICTGAAIAFLSGCQASIPGWADKYYLGWFLRVANAPGKFAPRYLKAMKIFWLLIRYGESLPAARP